MKEVQKGSVTWVNGWWYVVVEQKGEDLHSICDNANNIYSNKLSECELIATPYEAMTMHGWDYCPSREDDENFSEKALELHRKREIPADVIAEVLAGCHDDRFSHWKA